MARRLSVPRSSPYNPLDAATASSSGSASLLLFQCSLVAFALAPCCVWVCICVCLPLSMCLHLFVLKFYCISFSCWVVSCSCCCWPCRLRLPLTPQRPQGTFAPASSFPFPGVFWLFSPEPVTICTHFPFLVSEDNEDCCNYFIISLPSIVRNLIVILTLIIRRK